MPRLPVLLLGTLAACFPPRIPLDGDTGDSGLAQIDADNDGYGEDEDCDDLDADVHPGADELCNGKDDDCDDAVDEAAVDMATWYADDDGDGFGSPDDAQQACEAPDGYLDDSSDCDDDDAAVNPDAPEICNDGVDDACDDLADDEDPELEGADSWYVDADQDGFGSTADAVTACQPPKGYVADDSDCDDAEAEINPAATEACLDGVDNDCDGDVEETCAVLPAAASADAFQWQGQQRLFYDGAGDLCEGSIVMAVGDQAFCYADAEQALQCAGLVYEETWGSSFTATGHQGVEQVFLSLTTKTFTGNAICLRAGNDVDCMGDRNSVGQLGNGSYDAVSSFTTWGEVGAYQALATGTWYQFCAVDLDGFVWCAGYGYDATPELVDGNTHSSVWVDTYGDVQLDDKEVYRASEGYSSCQVTSVGLVCESGSFGADGQVVGGGRVEVSDEAYDERVCWLEEDGKVWCSHCASKGCDVEQVFAKGTALALAHHRYTDTLCAVYADGSLWCVGSNGEGKLGLGHELTLDIEEEVLPAGSFDLSCQPL